MKLLMCFYLSMNINEAKKTNVLNASNDLSTRVCNLLYCLYCAILCSTSIRVFNMITLFLLIAVITISNQCS